MNGWRRLLFACGQIGIMGLARFFFSWIVKYPEDEPETFFYSWFVRAGDQISSLLTSSTGSLPESLGRTFLFSATLVGLTVFLFRIFDGVTDPLAGGLSEAWVRKGKQRRSLLWGAFLIPPAGLALTFMPTHAMTPELRWGLLIAGMFVFFVGYTFYAIPYWTLIEDYSQGDVEERTLLSNLLGVGMFVAVAVVAVGSPFAITAWGYGTAALLFAAPCALFMILPYFAAPPPKPDAPPLFVEDGPGLWVMIKQAFRHRRFVAVLCLFAGSQMSFTFITAAAPFIAEKLLHGETADVTLLMAPFLGTAFLGFFVVPRMARKLGWEKAVVFASLALGVVYAGTAGLGYSVIGGPWTTAMVCFGLGGPMAAVLLGLEGEAISSCAKDGGGGSVTIYFGVFNFVIKGLNGVAILVGGILADAARGDWGNTAVRLMAFTAGGMLVVGVVAYFLVRPRDAAAPAVAEAK